MTKESNKERYLYINNLTCVLKGLEKQYTTIDLRNESCVTGKIKYVDGFMNVDMENAVYYDPMGASHVFDSFFVHARLIRYVHIPKHITGTSIVENFIEGFRRGPVLPKQKESSRMRRAKQYQQEIVKDIASSTN